MKKAIFITLAVSFILTSVAYALHWSAGFLVVSATLSILILAKYIGDFTEEIADHTGPTVGGLLNATFGNAVELIISILALRQGYIEIVQASITGSIVGNLLLVLGLSMFFGGWKHKEQTFGKIGTLSNGTVLLIAVAALVMPAVFIQTSTHTARATIDSLSSVISWLLIAAYGSMIFFSLKTHKHLFVEHGDQEHHPQGKSWKVSLVQLLISTGAVAWMSEILIHGIEPMREYLGWSELFMGAIFVAVIGNAAEHSSAITMAMKNRMNLSLQISIGSAVQIAVFVAPVLVLISQFMPEHMSLVFNKFELAAIVLSVLATNHIIQDGNSNWFEGSALCILYIIISAGFYFF